jgi:hypothetical protein
MNKEHATMAQQEKKKSRSPFFARFLEGQQFPKVKTDVKAGKKLTLRYPSDDDSF